MNKVDVSNAIELPLTIQLENMLPADFVSYYLKNKNQLESKLQRNGAVKFKGIQIGSLDDFQKIVDSISEKFLNYIDGNSPRTKLSGNVYTSTEYDKTQRITMHNELSYSSKWPNKLFFSCLKPAEIGGETLLADSRSILKKMRPEIVSAIREKGITYIRNLHGGVGMGPSWQDTFETKDKNQLEKYCEAYGIDYEWRSNGALTLKQSSKGIIKHRVTGELVWFNQIDQFHPAHLGEEVYEAMMAIYDSPDDFPMYVTLGDGTKISEDMLTEILQTIESVTLAPAWEMNELLIIDNELVSHGRSPFQGDRKVVVAMSE